MEKYAVIKLGGKQFIVEEGDRFSLERQSSLNPEVLLFSDGKQVMVGSPIVEGVKVKAEILKVPGKNSVKTRVGRFRNKSRYRKIKGHTQPMSTVKINSISHGEEKAVVKEKPVVKKTAVKKKAVVKKTVKSSPKRKATAKAAK